MTEKEERVEKIFIYTLGLLDELKTAGFVKGGAVDLSEKGRVEFQELRASGFEPTSDELVDTMDFLQRNAEKIVEELQEN